MAHSDDVLSGPQFLKRTQVQEILNCGKTKYWALVKAGCFDVVDVDGMKMATADSVRRYVRRLTCATDCAA